MAGWASGQFWKSAENLASAGIRSTDMYENNFLVVCLQGNCFENEWPSNLGSFIFSPAVHNIRASYGFQDILNLDWTLFKVNAERLNPYPANVEIMVSSY